MQCELVGYQAQTDAFDAQYHNRAFEYGIVEVVETSLSDNHDSPLLVVLLGKLDDFTDKENLLGNLLGDLCNPSLVKLVSLE